MKYETAKLFVIAFGSVTALLVLYSIVSLWWEERTKNKNK
jgi:hypothetical protein